MLSWPTHQHVDYMPWVGRTVKGSARIWALRNAQVRHGMVIADLGCGRRCWLAGGMYPMPVVDRVYLVDINRFPLKVPSNFRSVVSDLGKKIALPTNSVDRAFCISVLEHIDEKGRQKCMKEIERILKPGGEAYLSVAYFFNFTEEIERIVSESVKLKQRGSKVAGNLNLKTMFRGLTKLRLIDKSNLSEFPGYSRFKEGNVLKNKEVLKEFVRAEEEITKLGLTYTEVLIGMRKVGR